MAEMHRRSKIIFWLIKTLFELINSGIKVCSLSGHYFLINLIDMKNEYTQNFRFGYEKNKLVTRTLNLHHLLQSHHILGMALNCIQWWGSSFGELESVDNSQVHVDLSEFHVSNKSVWKVFVLDRNTWNHITMCKLFVLRIVTWSDNYLLLIIIIYLKPYNCLQMICIW